MSSNRAAILLIADPGAPAALAERVSRSLPEVLPDPPSGCGRWQVSVRRQAISVDENTAMADIISAVAPDDEAEDIVVYVTDLPRRQGTTPVQADISTRDRFAVISVPALGAVSIAHRLEAVVRSVYSEMTHSAKDRETPVARATRIVDGDVVHYVSSSGLQRMRLLAGMVYANRPWRLVTGMSKVMMAAFATGAVSLAYPTMWQLSSTMGPWRLGAATILTSAAMVSWLIVEHGLWERPKGSVARDRAVLYNASTVITLAVGGVVFHAALFLLLLLTAWWTLPPQLVAQSIGGPVDLPALLLMAWLVAAVATLGGALGSGMEDDDAVKAAAYGARQRKRFEDQRAKAGLHSG